LCLGSACGGTEKPTETAAEAPRPKPKNAREIAQGIVKGRLGALVYVDRVRGHAIAPKIASLDLFRSFLDGTGLDPFRDLERAYVASTGATVKDTAVFVGQHSLGQPMIEAAIDAFIKRSNPPGAWLPDTRVPSARVTMRGHTRVVSLIEPNFVVILPESLAREAEKFSGTGGFPDPEGQEAVAVTTIDPSHSLRAANAPAIPPTITRGAAKITLRADGGADIQVDGDSTSEAQAADDAAALTEAIDRATSVRVSIIKVRLFQSVPFRAEGSKVKADVHLDAGEIDRLLTLANTFLPH
jgi:hypothetical protein